jgi:hypothetical protein
VFIALMMEAKHLRNVGKHGRLHGAITQKTAVYIVSVHQKVVRSFQFQHFVHAFL